MRGRIAILAALGLAAALAAGTASAGGIPTPDRGHGHGHGHGKHYSQGYGHGRSFRYERHYGHRSSHGYRGGYGHHRGYGYYRGPARVVTYSRYEVHRHGPSCGHSAYSRGWTRSYSPYYYSRHRDYGRASFSGRDDGLGYYIEFDY